jgi:YegS/Rv2252/BmrU family lipid kinase
MRTVVFINAHSRQARQHVKAVRKFFAQKDSPFELLDFIVVEKLDDFDARIAKLKSYKKAECVIVGSGDGTIVAVLNALKGRDVVYGFVPLGTSNDFVWSLGLPADFKKTLRAISARHVQSVTLGSINDILFANVAGVGIATNVVNRLSDNRLKRYLGPLAYLVSGLQELFRHDAVWFDVTADGKSISFYTHNLLISNGKYHGHIPVHELSSLEHDNLMISATPGRSRLEWLRSSLRFLFRRPKKRKNILAFPVREAHIATSPVREIQADGEVIGKTPADIRVIKDAIRVFTAPEGMKRSLSMRYRDRQ